MILVDTSAWIEFDRATGSATDRRLLSLAEQGHTIAATEPVLMEVLARAATDEARSRLLGLLTSCEWLALDPTADFTAAAKIFTDCRNDGVTPRGLIDCLIAAVAIRTGAALLTADRDFARMADVLPLRLDRHAD